MTKQKERGGGGGGERLGVEREGGRGGGREGERRERKECRGGEKEGFVGWLLNIPTTGQCISGTDLHRQFYVLPH